MEAGPFDGVAQRLPSLDKDNGGLGDPANAIDAWLDPCSRYLSGRAACSLEFHTMPFRETLQQNTFRIRRLLSSCFSFNSDASLYQQSSELVPGDFISTLMAWTHGERHRAGSGVLSAPKGSEGAWAYNVVNVHVSDTRPNARQLTWVPFLFNRHAPTLDVTPVLSVSALHTLTTAAKRYARPAG